MKLRRNAAAKCRQHGWRVGDRLAGSDGDFHDVIEITAIGNTEILALHIACNGEELDPRVTRESECMWSLDDRRWRRVTKGASHYA